MKAFAHSLHILISPTKTRSDRPDRSPSTPSRSPKHKAGENSKTEGDAFGLGGNDSGGGMRLGGGNGSGNESVEELHVHRREGGSNGLLTATTTGTGSRFGGGSEKENQSTFGHTAGTIKGLSNHLDIPSTPRDASPRRPLTDLPLPSSIPEDLHPRSNKDKPLPSFLGLPPFHREDPSTVSSNSRSARIMDAWDPPEILPPAQAIGVRFDDAQDMVEIVQEKGSKGNRSGPGTAAGGGGKRGFRPRIKLSLSRNKPVFHPRPRPRSQDQLKEPTEGEDKDLQERVSRTDAQPGSRSRKNVRLPPRLTIHTTTTEVTSNSDPLSRLQSNLPVLSPLGGTVPTPFQAYPTPRSGSKESVPESRSRESGDTIRGHSEGKKSFEKHASNKTAPAGSPSPPRTPVNSHFVSLNSICDDTMHESPSKAVVRSASRVEIRRVPSKRVKLQDIQISGKDGQRSRVVSSTAIYDVGDTQATPTKPTEWKDVVENSPQLLSPLKIRTVQPSPGNSPTSMDASMNTTQAFDSHQRVSEIFFTPPSSTVETGSSPRKIREEEALRSAPPLPQPEEIYAAWKQRRRSTTLPSDLVRELEDQEDTIHRSYSGFGSSARTGNPTPSVIKVHFPKTKSEVSPHDGKELLSPPPRNSSRFAQGDSPTTKPRHMSFSSQPRPELSDILPEPYDSWPILETVPISIAPSQEIERMSDEALRAMVAGMGTLPSMILSQFEFQVLVEAAHRLKVVVDELSRKYGSDIRRRRRALLYLQQTVGRGDVEQCQRVVKVLSRMTEGVDLDQQRLYIAQDQLRQVEGLIGDHRQRVLSAALGRCTAARLELIAMLEAQKTEAIRPRSTASTMVTTIPINVSSPDLPLSSTSNGSKRKTSVRFDATIKASYRSAYSRNSKRASVRSQATGHRKSAQSALSIVDWSVYKFPLPPSDRPVIEEPLRDRHNDPGERTLANPTVNGSNQEELRRHSARVSSVDILFFRPGSDWGNEPHRDFPESPVISDPSCRLRRTHSEETLSHHRRSIGMRRPSSLKRLRSEVTQAGPRRHSSSTEPHETESSMMALCSVRPLSTHM